MVEITFDSVIDAVETLPDDQQELLVNIIQKRLSEKRREEISENITKVKEEFKKGDFRIGSVDDLINEIKKI